MSKIECYHSDGLSFLQQYNGRQAELVFIDPPFNTGKDWRDYKDSFNFDTWLKFLYNLFHASFKCLSPTGSIWVNVDEQYSHHVRLTLESVFGADCYMGTIVWHKKYRAGGAVRGISTTHNPIFAYSTNPGWRRKRGTIPLDTHTEKYKNPDNDPAGRWRLDHLGRRVYLSELMERGAVPQTWWDYQECGHTEQARKESGMFSTLKPVALLKRIIHISTDPGDLVIDPCVGSGTTLVAAKELGRDAIGIEKELATLQNYVKPRLDRLHN